MFQLFQKFQIYAASASYECYKSRSGCCICCKSMFQMFHLILGLCCSKCFHVVSCKCFMWMLHMLQWLYSYVASVLFQMFQMLQTFVAYVLSGCCIRFTHMFGSVSFGCCICFTHMLQVFHLDIAYVLQWLHTCFLGFHTYVASVSIDSNVCCKCFI